MVNESLSQPATKTTWAEFRSEMPVCLSWGYFDHAAVGPIPRMAQEKIAEWAHQAAFEGDVNWLNWQQQTELVRTSAAQILNASEPEIALIPNTTFGINLIVEGFPWNPGDNVVLPDNEFPSNAYPWLSLEEKGVEIRRIEAIDGVVCPNRMAAACDTNTKIVSCSWVGFSSGYRIDPQEMASVAHDNGALFFMDAIQGMGVFPLDVKDADIDFLAADGHKWMLGPEGAGVFYINQKHLDLIRPVMLGWKSVKHEWDFKKIELDTKEHAARYEGGSLNMAGFIGLSASLALLQRFGLTHHVSPIANQVLQVSLDLTQKLESLGAEIFSPRDDRFRSGIVSFGVPGCEANEIRKHLLKNQVVTSARNGRVRAATHCYNDASDIDRLIDALAEFIKENK